MFKKLINNPLNTIGNAIEINVLKVEKSDLEKERNNYQHKLDKYNNQIEFKNDLILLSQTNENTLNKLRSMFIVDDIKYDIPYDEFKLDNNEEYQKYKSLYDNLVWCNIKVTKVNEEINKNIGIDKQIYIDKINDIDNKLVIVNQKLRSVRDKQFGKKDD